MKPANAASVWFEDQTLCVELPGPSGLSHTLKLSPDNWGQLFSFLRQRGPASLIGELGDPTQAQLDREANQKLIKASKVKPRKVGRFPEAVSPETRAIVDQILREMGL